LKHLDIVIPCYNEAECVRAVLAEINRVIGEIAGLDYSVLFIDDGSRDATLSEIKSLSAEDRRVSYIAFSRNFGKEAAIFAGLQNSRGDAIVFMDADLQDPPELLVQMLGGLENGYDCVAAQRTNRDGEPILRSWFANRFYSLMNSFSDVKMNSGARDYRMMTAQMRDSLLKMSERERFSKGLFAWIGFKTKWVEFPIAARAAGKTKWSFFSLFSYAVGGIVAFTTAPLKIASIVGLSTVAAAIAYALYRLFRYGVVGRTPDEINTLLILFCSGIIIVFLGIIGEYLARIYTEVKRRPIYIVREQSLAREKTEGSDETRSVSANV
jgi:glycosyltransferase involved in cell wall biosynthesis